MRDYSNCYAVLGVTPDTDWNTLRARYKRLIGQWHPDRFATDATSKAVAEERSKEITLSYKALEKYRQVHGVLPRIPGAPRTPEPVAEPSSAAGKRAEAPSTTQESVFREPAERKPSRANRAAAVVLALATAGYFAYASFDAATPEEPAKTANASPSRRPPAERREISIGSTLGEVYEAQGVPTSTEGEVWNYGKSQIRFARGRVVSWIEHPDDPLQISRNLANPPAERRFGLGATKEEVRLRQGAPVAETDTVWDYTWIRVYFDRDRVVRWEESPAQLFQAPR